MLIVKIVLVMDELRMMRRIYDQQLSVVTDFFKHLQDLHDHGNPPNYEFLQGLRKILEDIRSSNEEINQHTMMNGHSSSRKGTTNGITTQQLNGTTAQAALRNGSTDGVPNGSATIVESTNGTIAPQDAATQNGLSNRPHKGPDETITDSKTVIPKSTLKRAESLIQCITMRRDELQDHEDTTKDISNQVRHFNLWSFSDTPFLHERVTDHR
jgi:hypothetical protein